MTGAQLATLVRRRTKTNTTTYSDADLLVDTNIFKDELASKIQVQRPQAFYKETTGDLVVSSSTRRYYEPVDVLNNISKLELKFTATGNFVKATPMKPSDFDEAIVETEIVAKYSNDEPMYFMEGKSFYILSGTVIAVTGGYRITYNAFPTDLASMAGATDLSITSSTAIGIPREFHELLARRISIEYKSNNSMKLNAVELNYERDLKKAIDSYSIPNLDEQLIGEFPKDKTDNGFNL